MKDTLILNSKIQQVKIHQVKSILLYQKVNLLHGSKHFVGTDVIAFRGFTSFSALDNLLSSLVSWPQISHAHAARSLVTRWLVHLVAEKLGILPMKRNIQDK